MRAGEVMTRDVVTVRPDTSVREAARVMKELNVGALPVCDGQRLVGMVTDRDIVVRATADGMQPDNTLVLAVMTEEVCSCFEDDPVEKIERAMAGRQIRRVPVVDSDKRLVGIVALGDLADDRVPETEATLRSISHPAEPDRTENRTSALAEPPPRDSRFGSPLSLFACTGCIRRWIQGLTGPAKHSSEAI
jgi:CBS domain-containing protein